MERVFYGDIFTSKGSFVPSQSLFRKVASESVLKFLAGFNGRLNEAKGNELKKPRNFLPRISKRFQQNLLDISNFPLVSWPTNTYHIVPLPILLPFPLPFLKFPLIMKF